MRGHHALRLDATKKWLSRRLSNNGVDHMMLKAPISPMEGVIYGMTFASTNSKQRVHEGKYEREKNW